MRFVCAVTACAVTTVLAGCSSPGVPPVTITFGGAVNPTADMDRQIQAWGIAGPKQAIEEITQDGPPITDSLVAGEYSVLGQQCAHLLSDVQAAQQLPPAPDQILQNYWSGALGYYARDAMGCESIAAEETLDNETLLDQYRANVTLGNDDLSQFVARLTAFNNGAAVPIPGQ